MKKTFRFLMLMALPMLLGLASCAEHDNPVDPNPLASQVSGMWYNIADIEGSAAQPARVTNKRQNRDLNWQSDRKRRGNGLQIATFLFQ